MAGLDHAAVRQRLRAHGLVQGVGLRPWLWQQAHLLGVGGWVRNTGDGIDVLLHGPHEAVVRLREALRHPPAPARVDGIALLTDAEPSDPPLRPFAILPSTDGGLQARIGADQAVCEDCLAEMFTPGARRWRHAFTHCTRCGPRDSLIHRLPYDRPHTAMAPFPPCADCAAEMASPQARRFHDQTLSCPACGPRLWLQHADGRADIAPPEGDPVASAWALLRAGAIVAIQGMGGFQLCCDATQPQAVARLRAGKRRPSKPLAVMAANTASLAQWVEVRPAEADWLRRPERPIVLLPRRVLPPAALDGVAPGLAWLGAMLPATPLHHLLFHDAAGRPAGTDWLQQPRPELLVVSSGNVSGAPMAIAPAEALRELAGVADAWLMHDRAIVTRADDSVLRVRDDGSACLLRRARGFVPLPVRWAPLPADVADAPAPDVLAFGGDLKATLCLAQRQPDGHWQATVSAHQGDLSHPAVRQAMLGLADRWPQRLQGLHGPPGTFACDLQPDAFSTELAHRWATPTGRVQGVQHHHAHIAAVLAEHDARGEARRPVIGLALDGHGLGSDGQPWGGELLRVHGADVQRLGRLRPLPLPGGDAAAREPWRMGAAVLHLLGRHDDIATRWPRLPAAPALAAHLAHARHLPHTSSLGRVFDAAAALLGLLTHHGHEGDGPMRLESLAARSVQGLGLDGGCDDRFSTHFGDDTLAVLDTLMPQAPPRPGTGNTADTRLSELDPLPLLAWLADQARQPDTQRAWAATVFHLALAAGLAEWAAQACRDEGIDTVVLAGGCLANRLLDEALHAHLGARGLTVWRPELFPVGDGALSLGQAWVALQMQASQAPQASSSP
ncbi:MAG: carbamoyltransferase HypF [Proteobacteria bacterium]|uniref:carbamoyltransferase HypF n=1 Tax=Aquabacterium sp. TaxID=1872578 RepID=UPI0035C71D8B|nr:carbamoyltransferase HypF [Pseudomonadota bacterium]